MFPLAFSVFCCVLWKGKLCHTSIGLHKFRTIFSPMKRLLFMLGYNFKWPGP